MFRLVTRSELAGRSDNELAAIFRQASEALAQSAPASVDRRNALASLENITREPSTALGRDAPPRIASLAGSLELPSWGRFRAAYEVRLMLCDRAGALLVGIFSATLVLGVTFTAHAKLIADFDRMSVDDQARYVTTLLDGSVGYLRSQKQDAMARKVIDHFNAKGSKGMKEFLENLEDGRIIARVNGRPYEVEHVMLVTLRRVGVDVPKGIMMDLAKVFKETPKK